MTPEPTPSAKIEKLLDSIIPKYFMGSMGIVEIERLLPLRDYIRTLESKIAEISCEKHGLQFSHCEVCNCQPSDGF